MAFSITALELGLRGVSLSKKVAALLAAFALGILLASFAPRSIGAGVSVALVIFSIVVGVSLRRRSWIVIILAVVLATGVIRYEISRPTPPLDGFAVRAGSLISVEGVVRSDASVRGDTQRVLLADVELTLPREPLLLRGERIRVPCTLHRLDPAVDRMARSLAVRGVFATCRSYSEPFVLSSPSSSVRVWLSLLRRQLLDRIDFTFPEPHASLFAGLLLGEKSLPPPIADLFRRAGLSHLVAASGQNVEVVSAFLLALLLPIFRRRIASVLLLVGIWFYAVLAGLDAPIVRAALMASVLVLAQTLGRIPSRGNVLLLTLDLMLLENPLLLRDDVGFQLSFAATAGLLLLSPRCEHLLRFLPARGGWRSAASLSLAAILATLPISILSFGSISLIAPMANVFAVPLILFILLFGAIAVALAFVIPSVALVAAAPAAGGLKLLLWVAALFGGLPFASFSVERLPLAQMFLVLLALVLLRLLLRQPAVITTNRSDTAPWRMYVFLAMLFSLPVLPGLLPVRDLRVTFFDVGQGDAILVEFPGGARWLVDGGRDDTVLWKLGQILPWFDRRIDVIMPTHGDADHIAGLVDVMRRYRVGRILRSDHDPSSVPLAALVRLASTASIPLADVEAGESWEEVGVEVRVLSPDAEVEKKARDRNDISVILLLTYGDTTMLLTGDAPQWVEQHVLSDLPHLDVLKAGHHGSYTATSQELLDVSRPDFAVLSVGANNRYGHPHGVVLRRLEDIGARIFRTDKDGDIRFRSSGGEPTVRARALFL